MRSLLGAAATCVFLLAASGCGMNLDAANVNAKPNTGFMVKQVNVNGETRNYGVFIPHDYTPAQRYPVIMFLHGVMEAGNNGTGCMSVGLGPYIAKHPESFKFIAVFPQSPGDWTTDERAKIAIACLDAVQRDYSTDTGCVTLTGLSNGGYGTWYVGANYRHRFSSLVPMGGYADYDDVSKLTTIPIWVFHNSGDFLVSSGGSREMVDRIKKAGGNINYSEFNSMGHNCWDEAFDSAGVFNWMLAQRSTVSTAGLGTSNGNGNTRTR